MKTLSLLLLIALGCSCGRSKCYECTIVTTECGSVVSVVTVVECNEDIERFEAVNNYTTENPLGCEVVCVTKCEKQ